MSIVRGLAAVALVAALAAFLATRVATNLPWFTPAGPIAYAPDDGRPTIVCLGDSLTYGTDAPRNQSYPAWLQEQLNSFGYHWRVVNAGVPGDRVADGLARLHRDVFRFHPRIVIVELGSNDPGHTPVQQWESGLDRIVGDLQSRGIRVILAGLDEPGMGDAYRAVSARYGTPLVWFIAEVARYPALWEADGHHPNGEGYKLVMQSFWPTLEPMVRAVA